MSLRLKQKAAASKAKDQVEPTSSDLTKAPPPALSGTSPAGKASSRGRGKGVAKESAPANVEVNSGLIRSEETTAEVLPVVKQSFKSFADLYENGSDSDFASGQESDSSSIDSDMELSKSINKKRKSRKSLKNSKKVSTTSTNKVQDAAVALSSMLGTPKIPKQTPPPNLTTPAAPLTSKHTPPAALTSPYTLSLASDSVETTFKSKHRGNSCFLNHLFAVFNHLVNF